METSQTSTPPSRGSLRWAILRQAIKVPLPSSVNGGMPFIGEIASEGARAVDEASEEMEEDLPALLLERGETSGAGASGPPLLMAPAEAPAAIALPHPDLKEKRKIGEVSQEEKAPKISRLALSADKKIKKVIANLEIDRSFAAGVEAMEIRDVVPYVYKEISHMYETAARLDIATQSVFSKLEKALKRATEEKMAAEDRFKITGIKLVRMEDQVSDLHSQLEKLNKERQEAPANNNEEIAAIRKSSAEEVASVKKEVADKIDLINREKTAEIDLIKKAAVEAIAREKREAAKEVAFARETVDVEVRKMKDLYDGNMAKVKAEAIYAYINSEVFVNVAGAIPREAVDETLNILERLGKLPSDFNHFNFYKMLPHLGIGKEFHGLR